MKLAVIKLGARIAPGGTSGGSGEALSILKILTCGGHDVHAYTKILAKDKPIDNVTMHQIVDEYSEVNADALIVINGSVNYFGGVDSPDQTLNYHVINHFNGSVYYVLCDPSLPLKQVWPSIAKKPWAIEYNQSDIEITRDDIIYISQPANTNKIFEDMQKHVPFKSCIHYPFEKFPLLEEKLQFKTLSERQYDLLYGGTFRNGRRQDDMIKYYFGYDEHKVTMFGKIKTKDFSEKKVGDLSHPNYEGAVGYQDFNEKMSLSKATVIIGDKYYKETDDLAQRIYESILSGVVTFIDADYDRNKRVYKDATLRNFLYVNSAKEVKQRLDIINNMTESQFMELLNRQYNDVELDVKTYCGNLNIIL